MCAVLPQPLKLLADGKKAAMAIDEFLGGDGKPMNAYRDELINMVVTYNETEYQKERATCCNASSSCWKTEVRILLKLFSVIRPMLQWKRQSVACTVIYAKAKSNELLIRKKERELL